MTEQQQSSTSTPVEVAKERPTLRLKYTHEAMIDLIIQDPTVTTDELAELFGFSRAWIVRVLSADSFQARLAERKGVLVDPAISQTLNERLRTVAIKSLDVVSEKLSSTEQSADYAIEALGLAAKSLGLQSSKRR